MTSAPAICKDANWLAEIVLLFIGILSEFINVFVVYLRCGE
jgi:hypothetical protein